MIFGRGKNCKLQWDNSGWSDFHTNTVPLTKNYSKCKASFSRSSIHGPNGSSLYELFYRGKYNRSFWIDFVVKHFDEDVEGGTVNGVTVRGINYIDSYIVPNTTSDYIRLFPDLDGTPSKYYDVVWELVPIGDPENTTFDLVRLMMYGRDLEDELI